MIQEVSVESTQETPASSTLEPAEPEPLEAPEVRGRSPQPVPEEPQESQEPEESEEPPPPPVPKTRVPPRVKPKAKPKAECEQSSRASGTSAPKAKPKAKRAPRKPPEDPPPDETDRFAQYSNTDLMTEMLKRTDQGERRNSTLHTALIAEIIARSNDHRLEQKRAMSRSFLQ